MNKLKGKKVIWIGDINLSDQNKIKSPDYKKLDTTLKSFNMVQTIQQITRVAKRGDKYTATTIDVVVTNCYSDFEESLVLPERIGDHQAIKCVVKFEVQLPAKYEKVIIRNYCSENIKSYYSYLKSTEYSSLLACSDVCSVTNGLNDHLNDNFGHFFPLKSIKKHPSFIFKPSKISLAAINKKKKSYSKFKRKLKKVKEHVRYCNDCKVCIRCINCDKAWEEYKAQRNETKKITKFNKRQNLIDDLNAKSSRNDLKGVWKSIKLAANMSPTNTQNNSKGMPDANLMNQHFCEIGPKLNAAAPSHL